MICCTVMVQNMEEKYSDEAATKGSSEYICDVVIKEEIDLPDQIVYEDGLIQSIDIKTEPEPEIETQNPVAFDASDIQSSKEKIKSADDQKPSTSNWRYPKRKSATAVNKKNDESRGMKKKPKKRKKSTGNAVKKTKSPKKCDVCQKTYRTGTGLKQHVLTHSDTPNFKCDTCQKTFYKRQNLVVHLQIHSEVKQFKCNVCQKLFSQQVSLNEHLKIHLGEKIFKCDVCQKSFLRKKELVVHARTHSGEKPYHCDKCGRSFSQSCNLTEHMKIHSQDKKIVCGTCQKSFLRQKELVVHARVHTGEKPFGCERCKRRFAQKGNLNKHRCLKPKKSGSKPKTKSSTPEDS